MPFVKNTVQIAIDLLWGNDHTFKQLVLQNHGLMPNFIWGIKQSREWKFACIIATTQPRWLLSRILLEVICFSWLNQKEISWHLGGSIIHIFPVVCKNHELVYLRPNWDRVMILVKILNVGKGKCPRTQTVSCLKPWGGSKPNVMRGFEPRFNESLWAWLQLLIRMASEQTTLVKPKHWWRKFCR